MLVCVDEAYSSVLVCISRRYTYTCTTPAHAAKLGGPGGASVHARRAGDVMNSSGAVVDGGALISAGRPGGGDETKRSQGEGCPAHSRCWEAACSVARLACC